jgi:ribulose 1,5-bisphosphate synthetase/thiazole synthase
MELETVAANVESTAALADGVAQLTAAAAQLERAAAIFEARFSTAIGAAGGDVAKVVATVESDSSARLAELEIKLQAAEQKIAELRAQSNGPIVAGRKTLAASAAHLLAKHGLDTLDQVNAGALDAALHGLSLEQRIAVKSQLMRAGMLG